ncbi:MAG: GumC family protein [Candidatus Scalindua sp.]
MKLSEISQNQNSSTSFLDVIGILYREKWVIIIITFVGSVGIFLYALISIKLPPEKSYLRNYYIPQAHVMINESAEGGVTDMLKSAGLGNLAGLAGIGQSGPTPVGLAQRISKTNTFLDTIAEEFDFYEKYHLYATEFPKTIARGMLRGGLQITSDPGSGMLTIGYKSVEKELATQIVNRVVELLEEQFAIISVDKNRTQLVLIEKRLKDIEAEMLNLQGELDLLQEKYNTFDLAALAKEQANRLASLRKDLLQKSLEIDTYAGYTSSDDLMLRKLKIERDSLKTNLRRLERGYSEAGVIFPAEKDLPDLLIQYTRLNGDLTVKRKIYESLAQQYELVKIQVESVPPTFQVYEKAEIPEMKAGPDRVKLCMIVAGASFFFSILLAFIVDYIRRVFKDKDSVKRLMGKY